MIPNLTKEDVNNINSFLQKMDSDMKDMHEMFRVEKNLAMAVEEFEKVFKRKLRITYDS